VNSRPSVPVSLQEWLQSNHLAWFVLARREDVLAELISSVLSLCKQAGRSKVGGRRFLHSKGA
jgi:hypothetical protein